MRRPDRAHLDQLSFEQLDALVFEHTQLDQLVVLFSPKRADFWGQGRHSHALRLLVRVAISSESGQPAVELRGKWAKLGAGCGERARYGRGDNAVAPGGLAFVERDVGKLQAFGDGNGVLGGAEGESDGVDSLEAAGERRF